MSFLFADSVDSYGTISDGAQRWDSLATNWSLVAASGTPFGVGQALSSPQFSSTGARKQWVTNDTTVYLSLRVKAVSNAGVTGDSLNLDFGDAGTGQVSFRFCGDGIVRAYTGSQTTLIGSTPAGTLTLNSWDSWQIKVVINNTTGTVELRKNGNPTPVLSLTGVNTRGGTANAYVNSINLYCNSSNTLVWAWDDLFVNSGTGAAPNTWPGDMRALAQAPSSSVQSQFAITGAASNILAVSEATENQDTSYISSSTVAQEDRFGLTAIATTYTVVCVTYYAWWKKTDSGARTGQISVAANGSSDTPVASNAAISTTYGFSSGTLALDPTGAAWTPANVNSAVLGVAVTA